VLHKRMSIHSEDPIFDLAIFTSPSISTF
jgi:hypothetical protein